MFKALLLISLIAVVSVYSQTLCEKYGNLTKATNQSMLITGVVVKAVGNILQDNGLRRFFDGSYTVKTNFTGDNAAFGVLSGKLVSFFGTALGCTDGTVPMYTGNLAAAHAAMNISYGEYNRFNFLVVQTLVESGFVEDDANTVANAINIRTLCTSTDMTCDKFCNKYSIPWFYNNSALMSNVINNVVGSALASPLLKPFFDGTTPPQSTNFTDPANGGKFMNLFNHLVQFFGMVLGCSDSSIPAYAGNPDLKAVHAGMPINKAAFEAFNTAIVNVLKNIPNVAQAEIDAIASILATTKGDICNQADCAMGSSGMTSNMASSMASSMGSSMGSNAMTSKMSSSMGSNAMTSNKPTTSSSSTTGNAFTLIFSVVALFVTLLI